MEAWAPAEASIPNLDWQDRNNWARYEWLKLRDMQYCLFTDHSDVAKET